MLKIYYSIKLTPEWLFSLLSHHQLAAETRRKKFKQPFMFHANDKQKKSIIYYWVIFLRYVFQYRKCFKGFFVNRQGCANKRNARYAACGSDFSDFSDFSDSMENLLNLVILQILLQRCVPSDLRKKHSILLHCTFSQQISKLILRCRWWCQNRWDDTLWRHEKLNGTMRLELRG